MKRFVLYTIASNRDQVPAPFIRVRRFGKYFTLFFLLTLFWACNPAASSSGGMKKDTFFDLEGYFKGQVAQLSTDQPSVRKKVRIGDQEEEKEVDGIDFSQELQIFSRSDINRPAWSDKYQVDSIMQDGQLTALSYTAIDTSLVTRLLEISFQSGKVTSIHILNRSHSAIAHTEQDLQYLPRERYQIVSTQKTIGSLPKTVSVEAYFEENGF
ncbi:MAG: hypothetical protein KDD15_34385 [Lewinella sp.]|nr:hypothetical protein [Lewinella sp.]